MRYLGICLTITLALSITGCDKRPTGGATGGASAAPAASAGPSAFDGLGISATVPAGAKAEAVGAQVDIQSSDGKSKATVTAFDDLASSGGYAGAKQPATFMGAKAEWKLDEKRPDGTWSLEWATTPKTGNQTWGVNYSYLVGTKAVICSGSVADATLLPFLSDTCKGLAPRAR